MTMPYVGGCACGAIRYETSSKPIFENHCQCRDCQKRSGTGHGSYLTFAAMPELVALSAGSLDDPGLFNPQVITYGIRGHAWDTLDSSLKTFERMPAG
jgi:hypothetical protein